jgi:SAM-dependent methyltransferase
MDQLNIPFTSVDVSRPFPFESNTFDLIYCSSLIEHVANPDNLLSESWRVLKPGGNLYLSFPPFFSLALVGGHQFKPFHFLGERMAVRLTNLVHGSNYRNYGSAYGNFGLYPLTIDRVKNRLLAQRFLILDIFARMIPINTARLPGRLKDLLTWHVCYLTQKPKGF